MIIMIATTIMAIIITMTITTTMIIIREEDTPNTGDPDETYNCKGLSHV